MAKRYARRAITQLVSFEDDGETCEFDQAANADDVVEIEDGEVTEVMPEGWSPTIISMSPTT